jgi:hypothetical protein
MKINVGYNETGMTKGKAYLGPKTMLMLFWAHVVHCIGCLWLLAELPNGVVGLGAIVVDAEVVVM